MSHNQFIHGGVANPTAWVSGYVPGQLDFQKIDQYLFESINGDKGGTWAPAAEIILGGSGLRVATSLRVDGTGFFDFNSIDVNISSAGFVTGGGFPSHFQGTVLFDAPVTFGVGGTLTVDSAATFNAALVATLGIAANGASLFTANVTFNTGVVAFHNGASFNTGGAVGFAVPVSFAAAVDLQSILQPSGSGRIRPRRIAGVNADHVYSIADADEVDIPTQSATHTYRVTNTGAGLGDRMLFTMASDATLASGNGILLLRDIDSTQIGGSIIKNATSNVWMEIVFDGTKWEPNRWGPYS